MKKRWEYDEPGLDHQTLPVVSSRFVGAIRLALAIIAN